MDAWMYGWIDGLMDRWMDGWMNGWMHELGGWMGGWMDGWMDGAKRERPGGAGRPSPKPTATTDSSGRWEKHLAKMLANTSQQQPTHEK